MIFTKKKRLLALGLWTLALALPYFLLQNTEYTMPITYAYFWLCLILSVLYVLVNGGITPILEEDRRREAGARKKYLADKGKMHPIKKKDKYRRFRIKKEQEPLEKEEAPSQPRPNPLRLPREKQTLFSHILLVLVIPFYLIFLLDWIYLFFFLKG